MGSAGEEQAKKLRITIWANDALAASINDYASQEGVGRSEAVRRLSELGIPRLLRSEARGSAKRPVGVRMPGGGTVLPLTGALVRDRVLSPVAWQLCDDAHWVSAVSDEVAAGMCEGIVAGAQAVGAEELSLETVESVAVVLCSDPAAPWMVGGERRRDALAVARGRVSVLLPLAESGGAGPGEWAELAWRASQCLGYPVADVLGAPPKGPARVVGCILDGSAEDGVAAGGAGAGLSTGAETRVAAGAENGAGAGTVAGGSAGMLVGARRKLIELLGVDEREMRGLAAAVRTVARSGLLDDEPARPNAQVRRAVVKIARFATHVQSGVREQAASAKETVSAAEALAQPGTQQILEYVDTHPQASLTELEHAAGISRPTLRHRLAALEAAGLLHNAGTSRKPEWKKVNG